jgi:hypothetical protein
MAKLNSGTRIYGTANVDTSIGIGGNVVVNTSVITIGNSSVNVVVNSSAVYVSGAPLGGATNAAAQYAWTNTHTFGANLTISNTSELILSTNAGIYANGSLGTAGQVLTSNGTTAYWTAAAAGVNTAASYAFSNTTASGNNSTGAITIVGGLGVNGNIYTASRVGFANTSNVSVVYTYYNQSVGGLDTVFG